MKLARCPICHHHISIETLVQDESGRELLGLTAQLPQPLAAPLLGYIGLFRPLKSDLNNARALRLLKEVIALSPNQRALAAACEQTVGNIHANRQQGEAKPLTNHNYLKKVLAGQPNWQQYEVIDEKHATASKPGTTAIATTSSTLTDTSWAD